MTRRIVSLGKNLMDEIVLVATSDACVCRLHGDFMRLKLCRYIDWQHATSAASDPSSGSNATQYAV